MDEVHEERQLVRSPDGRWKILPNRESAEERQHHIDRIALAGHLTGHTDPPMLLPG